MQAGLGDRPDEGLQCPVEPVDVIGRVRFGVADSCFRREITVTRSPSSIAGCSYPGCSAPWTGFDGSPTMLNTQAGLPIPGVFCPKNLHPGISQHCSPGRKVVVDPSDCGKDPR